MGIQTDISPAAKYRVKKESKGERQVLLWMEEKLTEQLDAIIRTGAFRNRSEAVTAAIHQFIEEKQQRA